MDRQNDLFLLMFTLSRMDDNVKIIRLFCERLEKLFPSYQFKFSKNKPKSGLAYAEEINTRETTYGYLTCGEMPAGEDVTSIQNAIQMLSVILDRLRIENELKGKAKSLESIAQNRLEAIRANVEELKQSKKESSKLIEDLKAEISRRKKTEEELRESEEKFRLSFHTTPDSVNINRLSDGLYIEVNQGFTDITGYEANEVIGKTSYEINIWFDIKDRERLVRELNEKGKCYNLEAKFRTKGGRIIHGLMSASLINLNNVPHIINITRDISDIKKAREDLEKSEQRFRKAFENSTSGMCIASPKGKYLQVNKKLCEILGYTGEELLGTSFSQITYHDDIEKGLDNIKDILDGKKDSFRFEKRYIRKDGEMIWGEVSSTLIKDSENKPLYFITHLTDITERIKAEEEIKKLNTELEKRVIERTEELENANKELEEVNDVFVGREMRIIELKEEVERLKNELKEK